MKNDAITDPEERVLYASINEMAGKKALAVPDFRSAVKYCESGLTFLDACHWKSHHDLTMGLHQTSVAALYSCRNGNQDRLRERINVIFRHAKSLDEEFKTRHVWIRILSTISLEEAIKECHTLLERLDEPIDLSNYSPSHACCELNRVKESLSKMKHQFSTLSRMANPKKLNAMKIMSSLMLFYNQQRSSVICLVSSKMVELSMKYGYCKDSVFGVASFAATLIRIQGDIDEGASWARTALALVSKFRHSVNVLLPAVVSRSLSSCCHCHLLLPPNIFFSML
jgi:ATP-dependent RNA helicase DDX31/DBP7